MCYLIAQHIDEAGCVALKTKLGKHLSEFKRRIEKVVGYEKIQVVTISRPSAYVEYEPYNFVETEEEFEYAWNICSITCCCEKYIFPSLHFIEI